MAFLTRQVYQSRRSSMTELMAMYRLDALAFLTPAYFFYATNFELDVEPWERPVAVVVPAGGTTFAIMHELSTNHLAMAQERGTAWLDEVVLYSEHPTDKGTPLAPEWPGLLAELLRGHGLDGARIGVDSPTELLNSVVRQLPDVTYVPLEQALRELRIVKHEEELALIRQAGQLSDWVQQHYREAIRPDLVVQALDFTVAAATAEEAARRYPGENVEISVFSLAGPESAAPHGTGALTGTRIERGHGIVNVVVIRLNGLAVENERTWFCGRPTARQIYAYQAALEAQEAALAQLVTGSPVASVDAAARAVFERHGLSAYVHHRTGHGIGISGHEFPHDMPFNGRALRSNEVYSAEPGVYLRGIGGFRHDDTVIVGPEPELVTQAPKNIEAQIVV